MTRSGPLTKRLLIGLVMMLTNLLFGCFYSGPQLVSPPSYPQSVRNSGGSSAMATLRDRQTPRKSAAQLVALSDGREPAVGSRNWRYIVVHHTATTDGDVESIDAVHRRRTDSQGQPWLGIGYHFVIGNGHPMADGQVAATFRWTDQLHGAHAGDRLHNEEGIGICLVGNFDQAPPTARQVTAAGELVQSLARRYGIPPENILPHSQVTATECPGRLFPWDELFAPHTDRAVLHGSAGDRALAN